MGRHLSHNTIVLLCAGGGILELVGVFRQRRRGLATESRRGG